MAAENEQVIRREASERDAGALLTLVHAAFGEYKNVLHPPSAAHAESVESVLKHLGGRLETGEGLGYRIVEYCTHPGYPRPTFVFMEKETR